MIVRDSVLSERGSVSSASAREALLRFGENGRYERVAFAGKTHKGRSGIAVNIQNQRMTVTGHKIDPIPPSLPDLVRHVPMIDARAGFLLAAHGDDVLIGDPEQSAIVLKWSGEVLEVYGRGTDSAV